MLREDIMLDFKIDYPEGFSFFFSDGEEAMIREDSLRQTIEDLRAERAQYVAKIEELDGILKGLEQRLSGKNGGAHSQTMAVHNKEFAGLGIAEAAVTMLKRANHPLHVKDIADGLRAGGYQFKTDKPLASVAPVLYMAAKRKKYGLVNEGKNTYSLQK
jgi:hypothetical protein